MRITHLGHSCVLLETANTRLLLDPGAFSSFEGLTDLDAVLITHQHFDHLDGKRLPALLDANPKADLIVDEGSAPQVEDLRLAARTVSPGEKLTVGGATVDVLGGTHATIHADIPVIPNIGYLIDDGAFYHPGDSLFVPDQDVDVLATPAQAPWMALKEAVDFLRAVKPRIAVPIHQALLAIPDVYYGMLDNLKPEGSTFTVLSKEEAADL